MVTTLSSLSVPVVVITTTSGARSNNNVSILTISVFSVVDNQLMSTKDIRGPFYRLIVWAIKNAIESCHLWDICHMQSKKVILNPRNVHIISNQNIVYVDLATTLQQRFRTYTEILQMTAFHIFHPTRTSWYYITAFAYFMCFGIDIAPMTVKHTRLNNLMRIIFLRKKISPAGNHISIIWWLKGKLNIVHGQHLFCKWHEELNYHGAHQ